MEALFESIESDINGVLKVIGCHEISFYDEELQKELFDRSTFASKLQNSTLTRRIKSSNSHLLSFTLKNAETVSKRNFSSNDLLSDLQNIKRTLNFNKNKVTTKNNKVLKTTSDTKAKKSICFFKGNVLSLNNTQSVLKTSKFDGTLPNYTKELNKKLKELTKSAQPKKKTKQLIAEPSEGFLERLSQDIMKRSTREDRLKQLEAMEKIQKSPGEIRKTVERLNKDAQRRMESKKLVKLFEAEDYQSKKKYDPGTWDAVYNERFNSFEKKRREKLAIKVKEKEEFSRVAEEMEQVELSTMREDLRIKLKNSEERFKKIERTNAIGNDSQSVNMIRGQSGAVIRLDGIELK